MRDWFRKRGIEGPITLDLRLKGIAVEHVAFRGTPTPEGFDPPARVTEPKQLADVIAAVAKLSPIPLRRGFQVNGSQSGQILRAFADDKRVTPERLTFVTNEAEMAIDVAHALVPLFGPLGANYGAAGWVVIDGTRTIADLRAELGKRYAEMARRMLEDMKQLTDLLQPLRDAITKKTE